MSECECGHARDAHINNGFAEPCLACPPGPNGCSMYHKARVDAWTCPGCGKVHSLLGLACVSMCECGRLATHVERQAQRNRNGVLIECDCVDCEHAKQGE